MHIFQQGLGSKPPKYIVICFPINPTPRFFRLKFWEPFLFGLVDFRFDILIIVFVGSDVLFLTDSMFMG